MFETLTMFFDEIGIKQFTDFTEQNYIFNSFWFEKLSNNINIQNTYEIMSKLYLLFVYNTTIFSMLSDGCQLCKIGFAGVEAVSENEIKHIQKKTKYKLDEKDKNNNYFYEYAGLKFEIENILLACDQIRKTLIENGDTIEMIEKRDFVLSLQKYYLYLSEGISYG